MAQKEKKTCGARALSQRSLYIILLAAALYLVAAYLNFFTPDADVPTVSIIVSMATAMVAIGILRAWQESKGEPLADERTILVHRIAVGYSWWFSYVVIALLMLASQFNLATFSVEGVLSLVFFTMIASLLVFRLYVSRQGVLG